MDLSLRDVITIDREECVGCGHCVTSCVGGALQLVNGKAVLTREDYCDGLGVCVRGCPEGALKVRKREAVAYQGPDLHQAPQADPQGCPGAMNRAFGVPSDADASPGGPSALTHWPIQLHLIMPQAAQFRGTDLLLAASCTAFSYGTFHADLEARIAGS